MVMAACLAGISWIGWAHCRATSLEKQCERKGHPHWPLRLIFKPKAAKRKISRNEISPTVTQSNFVLSIADKQQPLWQPAPPCGTWVYKWQNRLLQVASIASLKSTCQPLMSVAQAFLVSRYCTSTGTTSTSKAPRVVFFPNVHISKQSRPIHMEDLQCPHC